MASILLVDDEQNILLTYRTVLERGGHRVSTASTAEDAIRVFETEGADVIVTDMNMPGMSGIDLVKLIRQHSPDTEIIVMTGAGSERTGLQQRYENAVRENVAQRYNDVRQDARAIIDACATPLRPTSQ